ncbi:MAG: hypothetical protein J6A19_11760 [Oscillospiraceae bacterium]|nr:hypothetical protein [Oscillospiraceae bacterium]
MTEFSLSGFCCRAEQIGCGRPALVLLFSGFERELFGSVSEILRNTDCQPLTLAEFGEIDWDRDYSPWEAELDSGRKFSSGADRLLQFLPEFTAELEQRFGGFSGVYLCGYSLGGLFALYAAALSEPGVISGAASCSGSMWFPGWTEFLKNHPLHGKIYLSLGGKEKNSPDPLMASVEDKTNEVKRIAGRTAQVTYVHESGGHFSRIPQRICRGIMELLK